MNKKKQGKLKLLTKVENMDQKLKKIKKEKLEWVDSQSGATFHAGAAFYNERFGDFKLVVDAPRTVYNLVPYEVNNKELRYKVYTLFKTKGKFNHKVEVGYGYSNSSTNGDIYMLIGRYGQMRLVLRGMGFAKSNVSRLKVA